MAEADFTVRRISSASCDRVLEPLTRPSTAFTIPSGTPDRVAARPLRSAHARHGLEVIARFFAREGYACAHEVDDGCDPAEWAVAQEWCDGRIGMWGESYYGATSWAAAISGHPAVRCIAPGDIGVDRRASWFRQGASTSAADTDFTVALSDVFPAGTTRRRPPPPSRLPIARRDGA